MRISGWAFVALVATSAQAAPATLFQWEDYMDPPFLADYEARFHEKPNVSIFADEDEAFAKMRAGYKPDVMGPCYYEFPRWQEAGLLQPIDTTKLKNWSKLSPISTKRSRSSRITPKPITAAGCSTRASIRTSLRSMIFRLRWGSPRRKPRSSSHAA